MHRIGRDGLNVGDFDIQEHDCLVLVFGEIDVRYHIEKQRCEHRRSINEIISTLITQYIAKILLLRNVNGIHCIVFGPVPQADNAKTESGFFSRGTLADRVSISRALNEKLAQVCSEYDIPYFDVLDAYATPTGELDRTYADANVHIRAEHNEHIKNALFQTLEQHNLQNFISAEESIVIEKWLRAKKENKKRFEKIGRGRNRRLRRSSKLKFKHFQIKKRREARKKAWRERLRKAFLFTFTAGKRKWKLIHERIFQ